MGKAVHRITVVNEVNRQGICSNCGPVKIRKKSSLRIPWRCNIAAQYFSSRVFRNRNQKRKDKCEMCGFTAKYPIQLDRNHRDGNHQNNHEENIEILCANCHRQVTWEKKHYLAMARR